MKKIINIYIIMLLIVVLITGCNKQKDNSKGTDEFIGKWNTVKAVNAKTGEETNYLKDVFGSSFEHFGSYLILKEDGTFIDNIIPITDGSKSNTGTYSIKRDYNKIGDAYIFLTYSDGNKEKFQRVKLDETNELYLVLDTLINDYQLYLKKS